MNPQTEIVHFEGQPIYMIGPMKQSLSILQLAHQQAGKERFALLSGVPGLGKTLAAKYFQSLHSDTVAYLEMPARAMMTPGRFLQEVQRVLGLAEKTHLDRFTRAMQIVESLRSRPRTVILDQALRACQTDYLDIIHWLHDNSPGRFIFIDVPAIEGRLSIRPAMQSRFTIKFALAPAAKEELEIMVAGMSEPCKALFFEATGCRMRETVNLARLINQTKGGATGITTRQLGALIERFMMRAA